MSVRSYQKQNNFLHLFKKYKPLRKMCKTFGVSVAKFAMYLKTQKRRLPKILIYEIE